MCVSPYFLQCHWPCDHRVIHIIESVSFSVHILVQYPHMLCSVHHGALHCDILWSASCHLTFGHCGSSMISAHLPDTTAPDTLRESVWRRERPHTTFLLIAYEF